MRAAPAGSAQAPKLAEVRVSQPAVAGLLEAQAAESALAPEPERQAAERELRAQVWAQKQQEQKQQVPVREARDPLGQTQHDQTRPHQCGPAPSEPGQEAEQALVAASRARQTRLECHA